MVEIRAQILILLSCHCVIFAGVYVEAPNSPESLSAQIECMYKTFVDPNLLLELRAGWWKIEDVGLKKWSLCLLVESKIMTPQGVFVMDEAMRKVPFEHRLIVAHKIDQCLPNKKTEPIEIAWRYLKCVNEVKLKGPSETVKPFILPLERNYRWSEMTTPSWDYDYNSPIPSSSKPLIRTKREDLSYYNHYLPKYTTGRRTEEKPISIAPLIGLRINPLNIEPTKICFRVPNYPKYLISKVSNGKDIAKQKFKDWVSKL